MFKNKVLGNLKYFFWFLDRAAIFARRKEATATMYTFW